MQKSFEYPTTGAHHVGPQGSGTTGLRAGFAQGIALSVRHWAKRSARTGRSVKV